MSNNKNDFDPKAVYVQNINYRTDEETLSKAFEKFGKVSKCRILKDRLYGQYFSRGTGFVEFEQEDSVDKAINDKDINVDGRNLSVSKARKKYEKKNDTAFVSGIPHEATTDDLMKEFIEYGATEAKIVFENAYGRRGGYAFVKFSSNENRDKAVSEKKHFELKGEKSTLSIAKRDFDEAN